MRKAVLSLLLVFGFSMFAFSQSGNEQHSSCIFEELTSTLNFTIEQIFEKYPNAIMTDSTHIMCGHGGFLGDGFFFGYSWEIENGFVKQSNYIAQYTDEYYQQQEEIAKKEYGEGIDINGNGTMWNVVDKKGNACGMCMINGNYNIIVFGVQVGFIEIPGL